jgi:hypothetical protein
MRSQARCATECATVRVRRLELRSSWDDVGVFAAAPAQSPPVTVQRSLPPSGPFRYVKSALAGGDATLESQTNESTFGIESAAAERVSASHRAPPQRRR